MTTPQTYMTRALELAKQGCYTVSPNPMVGCVIVKNDQIIGEGYHQKAGEPHAEVFALRQAGEQASGATAYVTLEPCCHHGRTPPCIDALINAGISSVIVAVLDPNPLVAGKGIEILRTAGIEVSVGLCAEAATELNQIFFHYIKTQQPFVIAKWAMSLDGKTITATCDSRQISGNAAQQAVHDLRQRVDAILIGAQTARFDNPQLTARFNLQETAKQPIRIILSHSAQLPDDLQIFTAELSRKTWLAVAGDHVENETMWQKRGIEIIHCQVNQQGDIDLKNLLQQLGQRSVTSLLVEGGEQVRQQFFADNLVNQVQVYLAPSVIGNLPQKSAVHHLKMTPCGEDFYIQGDM